VSHDDQTVSCGSLDDPFVTTADAVREDPEGCSRGSAGIIATIPADGRAILDDDRAHPEKRRRSSHGMMAMIPWNDDGDPMG